MAKFRMTRVEPPGWANDKAYVEIRLTGPTELDRLARVEVFIRDDHQRELVHPHMGGPTQADINAQVWGPCRFAPGIDGAPSDGRRVPAFELNRGSTRKLLMERTQPPPWSQDQAGW